jgi:hypothetical protein
MKIKKNKHFFFHFFFLLKERLKMRIRLTFSLGTNQIVDQTAVSDFPEEYWV